MKSLPIEVHASPGQMLGMPPATFMRDYWQQRPLLIRGALMDQQEPLTPEDLAGLACEELALARLVLHDRTSDGWSVQSGPLAESDFADLPHSDWTLLVQDVDKWDADVAAMLQHFSFLPSWRIDDIMVSYAVPGGSVGAHIDQYDVFLLQGRGERRWQINSRADASSDFRDDTPLRLLREFHPDHDWVVQPGDLLYLPPGVPHHGVALSPCLTYSIGMRAPALSEMLLDLADHLAAELPDTHRHRDAGIAPATAPGQISSASLERIRQELSMLPGVDTHTQQEWFGRFITRYRLAHDPAALTATMDDDALQRELDDGASLFRHPFTRAAWIDAGNGRARLFVNGTAHDTSATFAQAVCAAEPMLPLAGIALCEIDRISLLALINDGHLVRQVDGDNNDFDLDPDTLSP